MDFKGLEEKFKCLNNSKNSIQKIVSHESFVYIANGNKIGCYLIAQKSKATEYQELFSKEIEFDIIDLSINNNGTYLALYGSNEQGLNKLCVIPLFELNIILSSNIQINPLLVRVLEIDSNNMKDSKIMKVAWHPLSKESTALLVLSSNNFLRLYDIEINCIEPELVFDLNKENLKCRNKGIEENVPKDEIVDLAFGSIEAEGWEPFTVLFATKSYKFYYLCPLIPKRCLLPRKNIKTLFYLALKKFNTSNKEGEIKYNELLYEYATRPNEVGIYHDLIFLISLTKFPIFTKDKRFIDVDFYSHKMNMKNFLKLKRVEIFASKPPLPKNSRIVPVVKNILTIPTTSLTILCTIFEDGRFVIKAITSFLEPSFYDNKKLKNEQNEEAFVVLQILKFKEFSKHKLNTLFDPLFPSHLYICSRDNGYVVDFTDLINNIKYNHFPEQLGSPCPVNEIISNKKEDIAINDMCFINHKNVESAFLWFIGVNQREEIVSKTKFIKPFIPAPLSKLYSVSKISHLSDQANLYQANKRESGYTFSGFNSKLSFTDRVLDSKDSTDITLNALKNKLKGLEANIKHLNLSSIYFESRISHINQTTDKITSLNRAYQQGEVKSKQIKDKMNELELYSNGLLNNIKDLKIQVANLKIN